MTKILIDFAQMMLWLGGFVFLALIFMYGMAWLCYMTEPFYRHKHGKPKFRDFN